MELLICHLIGDFVLQIHTMAVYKTTTWLWAIIHAAFYSIPFAVLLLLTDPTYAVPALAVIGGTHAVIDRLGIAGKWCRWYGVGHPGLWWTDKDRRAYREQQAKALYETWDGSKMHPWVSFGNSHMQDEARRQADDFPTPPPFLGVWLTIIVDNTLHLAINAAVYAWATA